VSLTLAVLISAGLSVLGLFGLFALSLRMRGLPVKRWPFVAMGTGFVGFFVWVFGGVMLMAVRSL
jgi:hypothetical protein